MVLNNFIKSFIPKHIKNDTVLAVYDLLRRKTNRISESVIRQNAVENSRLLHSENRLYIVQDIPDSITSQHLYIENQAQWEEIKFGKGKKANMSYCGCGVIAVYNALAALQESISPDIDIIVGLISSFERDGAALNGKFGVAPCAIYNYFKDKGYETVAVTDNNIEVINRIGKDFCAVVVTAYNNKNDITDMIHTVCITKRENGEYVIHNGYRKNEVSGIWEENRTGMFTLADAISKIGRDSAAICIIGINSNRLSES